MSLRAKRNGLIEPSSKNKVLDHKVEEVIIGNKRFTITTYIYDWFIDIFIGNQTIYCIRATVPKRKDGMIKNSAFIDKVRWEAECSNPFERGKDTTTIFKLLMTYIKKNYPDVHYAEFNDASNRKCDNGGWVNLAAMKLFTDGKTWYEDHFNAKIDEHSEVMYRTMIANANRTKQGMTWDQAKLEMPWTEIGIPEQELKEHYEGTETWTEWFKWIRTTIGDSAFCVWLSKFGWFEQFLRSVLKCNIMYYIFKVNVNDFDLPYNIMKGGRRKEGTQKRRRAKVLLQ